MKAELGGTEPVTAAIRAACGLKTELRGVIETMLSAGEGQMNRPRFQPLGDQGHPRPVMPEALN